MTVLLFEDGVEHVPLICPFPKHFPKFGESKALTVHTVSFFNIYIYICGEDLLGLFRSYVHMSTRALNYDLGQGSLGYGLTFWPSFTCVCRLLLGWKDCPIKSMKQELFDIDFTSSVVFTISSCCNLGERVCSCLLLLGWKGCRLVYLFAVARVQGLAQALFRRLGSSAPPPFTSLTSPSWRIFIYLFMGRKRVLFCQSRRQVSSENHVFPFVRCVFHLMSLFPM